MPEDTFTVTMPDALLSRFSAWLDTYKLMLVQLPDEDSAHYHVVRHPRPETYPGEDGAYAL